MNGHREVVLLDNGIAVEHIPTTRIAVEQFPSLYIRVHLQLETVLQDFAFIWH